MTTFNETTRIERIALIARAMELDFLDYHGVGVVQPKIGTCYRYDPYTSASQSQDVQERLGIQCMLDASGQWLTNSIHPEDIEVTTAPTLREAIADCAARWQWEKEREGR